jgi:hypothetical protein
MTRIQLRTYIDPGAVEVICKVETVDGGFARVAATVDTGTPTSLFPIDLLANAQYRRTEQGTVTSTQAGIAKQSFEAVEAYITVEFEDIRGNYTKPFEIRAWFTDTDQALIGFSDVLDRGVLHIDMPQQLAWLEMPD